MRVAGRQGRWWWAGGRTGSDGMRCPREQWQRRERERCWGGGGGWWYASEETAKHAGRAAEQTMLALSVHLGKGLYSDESWLCASRRQSGEILVTLATANPTLVACMVQLGSAAGDTPHAEPSPQTQVAAAAARSPAPSIGRSPRVPADLPWAIIRAACPAPCLLVQ